MTIDVQTECRYRKLTVLSQHNIFIGFIHHHCKAIYGDRYDMAVPKIKLLHGHILCILAAIIRVHSIWRNHIQFALCSASMHSNFYAFSRHSGLPKKCPSKSISQSWTIHMWSDLPWTQRNAKNGQTVCVLSGRTNKHWLLDWHIASCDGRACTRVLFR